VTALYDDMASTADALIGEFGRAVTITYWSEALYDPTTSAISEGRATASGFGVTEDYDNSAIDGASVLRGDRKLLLSPLDDAGVAIPAPSADDTAEIGGVTWTVIGSHVLDPGGTPLLYTIQLRK
jgi:hypothetical protein